MHRRLYHIAAFLLAAVYACDGVVMHVAHQYYHLGHQHSCCAVERETDSQHLEGSCCHSHTAAPGAAADYNTAAADYNTAAADNNTGNAGAEHAAGHKQQRCKPPVHDHQQCEICRYLAVQWIDIEPTGPPAQPRLVVEFREAATMLSGFDLYEAPRCRAPPIV